MQRNSDTGDSGRYAALAARAYEYLRGRQGSASEDDLTRHLFGPTAKGPMFADLLTAVLSADPRFGRREDGRWLLLGFETPDTTLDQVEFVVLDLEATGLRARRQRLFELAALRLARGVVTSRFTAVLDPGRRFPAYLADLTGLTQGDLGEAPAFAEVADDLLAFLGDAVLVGHGLTHDLLYLNGELERAGKPPLANHVLDTLALAERYLPSRGKPTLDNLAVSLGLPVGRRHRALADAHLVAGILAQLLARARGAGARTLRDLPLARREMVGASLLLDASALDDVADVPGVYLLKNGEGQVVYVGKAADLHSRLATYFSRPPAYVRRMEGLLEAVADFETIELGSDLEALLEEARLIADLHPRFNVQTATRQYPRYLRLDIGAPVPRLEPVDAPAHDGARYVGPYANQGLLRAVQRHLGGLFPLATCRCRLGAARKGRKQPRACPKLDQARCLGPCLGLSTVQVAYRELVDELLGYLGGDTGPTRARVGRELAAALTRGDGEAAARLRRLLVVAETPFVGPVETGGKPLRASDLAVVQPSSAPGWVEVFVLRAGRYAGQLRLSPAGEAADLAGQLQAVAPLPAQAEAGRGEIMRRWLGSRPAAVAILPNGDADWVESAEALLALAKDVVDSGLAPGALAVAVSNSWLEGEDE